MLEETTLATVVNFFSNWNTLSQFLGQIFLIPFLQLAQLPSRSNKSSQNPNFVILIKTTTSHRHKDYIWELYFITMTLLHLWTFIVFAFSTHMTNSRIDIPFMNKELKQLGKAVVLIELCCYIKLNTVVSIFENLYILFDFVA